MNLDVTASHAWVSLNPFPLARLEFAMMTVTPVVIVFLTLGQEQLYRGPDFGQGQFSAKLVPRLPVLLWPCYIRKSRILSVADSTRFFDASAYRLIPLRPKSIGWDSERAERRTDSKVREEIFPPWRGGVV